MTSVLTPQTYLPADVADLDSVDHVLAAAPRVEPPPGFAGAVLTAIGLAVVFAGIAWKRRAEELTEGLRAKLPGELRALLAARQSAR